MEVRTRINSLPARPPGYVFFECVQLGISNFLLPSLKRHGPITSTTKNYLLGPLAHFLRALCIPCRCVVEMPGVFLREIFGSHCVADSRVQDRVGPFGKCFAEPIVSIADVRKLFEPKSLTRSVSSVLARESPSHSL